ncbi:hypothetical protein L484_024984 [Morus notabilis]|uniref:Uncharacterized protein n=1 Tax=Morus notabilis TaxID=981085 RepID=W9QKF6_9ROSA|nr:hypothetical protein L484_024984 [Morus notabilis]
MTFSGITDYISPPLLRPNEFNLHQTRMQCCFCMIQSTGCVIERDTNIEIQIFRPKPLCFRSTSTSYHKKPLQRLRARSQRERMRKRERDQRLLFASFLVVEEKRFNHLPRALPENDERKAWVFSDWEESTIEARPNSA